VFFASILALSNTGGAASPVGDFPAIVIMTSGITDFLGYLTHAFPLFAITSVVLILVWGMTVKKEHDDGALRKLAVCNLKSQYKNITIRFDVLKWLSVVFVGMFLAWSFVPQEIIPPEIIAVLGYAAAMLICGAKGIKVEQNMDLKSVLTIASFLFFAEVISQTGILEMLAAYMQNNIESPKLLVMAIMVITSLVAGIFSAGPAAAAMMPIIVQLCNGPLNAQSDWIAVAYAAAICAGSSLFMWSATAGFILSGKVNAASIEEENGNKIPWCVGQYMKYGILNYVIQLGIALAAMVIIL
jgi:Na+/H+ antiporter NhaD/arsenite permease-like protein